MKRLILPIIVLFGIISFSLGQTTNTGALTIKINGFRNEKGLSCVSLFNNTKGFPGKYDQAYKIIRSGIKGKQVIVEFTDVPYGIYAVSVLHDENSNNKLDTNFIGMPKEGVGVSNNPKTFMGPPSYSASQFNFQSPTKTLEINLKYL